MTRKKRKLAWYAACDGIRRMGPFDDQVEAWKALIVDPGVQPDPRIRNEARAYNHIHALGAKVWPEYA